MSRRLFLIIIFILLLGNIFFGRQYWRQQRQVASLSNTSTESRTNRQIVDFSLLFIDKVLRATGEVDFETRLLLENKVRELADEEILSAWKTFIGAKDEAEAQQEVLTLLELLIKKIQR